MSINNVQRAHLRGTRQQPSLCFPLDILPALCVNHNYPTNSPFTVISPLFFSRNNAATSHTHTRKPKKSFIFSFFSGSGGDKRDRREYYVELTRRDERSRPAIKPRSKEAI
jgi:hypothetical protein